jgi:hypothetical protein
MLGLLYSIIAVSALFVDTVYAFTYPGTFVRHDSLRSSLDPNVRLMSTHPAQLRTIFPIRSRPHFTSLKCTTDTDTSKFKYEVKETRKDYTVILPIDEGVRGKDVECAITKSCLLLGIKGQRIIDAELWSAVKPDASYWEIDSDGGRDRCVIIKLVKLVPEEWPFLLKSDYSPATDFAGRRIISRPEAGVRRARGPRPSRHGRTDGAEMQKAEMEEAERQRRAGRRPMLWGRALAEPARPGP